MVDILCQTLTVRLIFGLLETHDYFKQREKCNSAFELMNGFASVLSDEWKFSLTRPPSSDKVFENSIEFHFARKDSQFFYRNSCSRFHKTAFDAGGSAILNFDDILVSTQVKTRSLILCLRWTKFGENFKSRIKKRFVYFKLCKFLNTNWNWPWNIEENSVKIWNNSQILVTQWKLFNKIVWVSSTTLPVFYEKSNFHWSPVMVSFCEMLRFKARPNELFCCKNQFLAVGESESTLPTLCQHFCSTTKAKPTVVGPV